MYSLVWNQIVQAVLTAAAQFFVSRPHLFIRKVAPDVKMYTWYAGSAYNGTYLFGPESLGGHGDLLPKIEEDVAKTGKPFDIVSVEVSLAPRNFVAFVQA